MHNHTGMVVVDPDVVFGRDRRSSRWPPLLHGVALHHARAPGLLTLVEMPEYAEASIDDIDWLLLLPGKDLRAKNPKNARKNHYEKQGNRNNRDSGEFLLNNHIQGLVLSVIQKCRAPDYDTDTKVRQAKSRSSITSPLSAERGGQRMLSEFTRRLGRMQRRQHQTLATAKQNHVAIRPLDC